MYPASALQSDRASLPVLLPVPELDGQLVQASALCADVLYVPAPQADTCAPLPVNPASARQSDSASLPVLEPVPELSGQLVQGKFVCAQTTPPTVMEGAFEPKSGQPHGQNVRTQPDGMVIDGEWRLGAPWNADVKAPGADKVVCRIEEGKKVAV